MTYPNGDTFEGAFNDNKKKHGRGIYTWSTSSGANPWVPEGGYPEGKAPIVRYEGAYFEGRKEGVGKMTFPNGEKYHGMWEADRFMGDGTYFYSNGDIYSGGWHRGIRQGEGVLMYKADESQLVGRWERGSFVSGKWVMKDGTSWHGPFKAGKPLGRGIFYFTNGTMQEGEYVQEGEADGDGMDDAAAELKITWKGGPICASNATAEEVRRAPIKALTSTTSSSASASSLSA